MSIAASLFSIFYNYFIPPIPMWIAIFWNGIFIIVNLYHIAILIYEKRPVKMNPKDKELYDTMFKSMSPVEFLKITKIAKWKKFKKDDEIISQNKPVKDLHLIYNGTVDVVVGIQPVAELRDGQFVGEMSFLTEKPATATCIVKHDTECMIWNQEGFKDLLKRNPSLYFSIQSLLSAQVSDALVNSSKK
jgi:signal-transduction protein with cAMP-binding, CBS, and nucleotidyltransferase domain